MNIIDTFLEDYGQGRLRNHRALRLEDSLTILRLHRKFALVVQEYCRLVLAENPLSPKNCPSYQRRWESDGSQRWRNLRRPNENCAIPQPSPTELRRLYRACWRWHIYNKLFGWIDSKESLDRRGQLEDQQMDSSQRAHSEEEVAEIFFGMFPIHEVEELACLHSYAAKFYISNQMQVYPMPMLVQSLINRGPEFMHEVQTASSKQKFHALLDDKDFIYETSMRHALDAFERVVDSGRWPWKGQDDPQNEGRQPTKGWRWASSRGNQNTDLTLRRWGYVFWDDTRLVDEWGITKEQMINWPWPDRSR